MRQDCAVVKTRTMPPKQLASNLGCAVYYWTDYLSPLRFSFPTWKKRNLESIHQRVIVRMLSSHTYFWWMLLTMRKKQYSVKFKKKGHDQAAQLFGVLPPIPKGCGFNPQFQLGYVRDKRQLISVCVCVCVCVSLSLSSPLSKINKHTLWW